MDEQSAQQERSSGREQQGRIGSRAVVCAGRCNCYSRARQAAVGAVQWCSVGRQQRWRQRRASDPSRSAAVRSVQRAGGLCARAAGLRGQLLLLQLQPVVLSTSAAGVPTSVSTPPFPAVSGSEEVTACPSVCLAELSFSHNAATCRAAHSKLTQANTNIIF